MTDHPETPASLLIAAAQFAPTDDTAANARTIAELVATAAGRGASVVLLPEYADYFVDPFDPSLRDHAQDVPGAFTTALQELAARHDVTIVASMLERAADGRRVHNTLVAVDASGVVARYRKVHLYDAFGQRESDWVAPGEPAPPEIFERGGIRFGLQTCYDLRFPEVSRVLVDAGADVLLVPAEWVRGPLKEAQWTTLLHARAIENTVYVVAADHTPPIGVGLSTIVDPQGVAIAALGTGEGIAVAEIDRAQIDAVRRRNPALSLRRYRVEPR